jgi:hypothetical protein
VESLLFKSLSCLFSFSFAIQVNKPKDQRMVKETRLNKKRLNKKRLKKKMFTKRGKVKGREGGEKKGKSTLISFKVGFEFSDII